jgi:hypothetical protein
VRLWRSHPGKGRAMPSGRVKVAGKIQNGR